MRDSLPRSRAGFSLPELLTVLAVIAILAAAAGPRLIRFTELVRARAALDLIVAEVYHARMLAVETGRPVQLRLVGDGGRCVRALQLSVVRQEGVRISTRALDIGRVCLRHTGDAVLHYSARGFLRPPGRSVHARIGATSDSVVLAVSGRVRRSY